MFLQINSDGDAWEIQFCLVPLFTLFSYVYRHNLMQKPNFSFVI